LVAVVVAGAVVVVGGVDDFAAVVLFVLLTFGVGQCVLAVLEDGC
jgi:hypothetical protein